MTKNWRDLALNGEQKKEETYNQEWPTTHYLDSDYYSPHDPYYEPDPYIKKNIIKPKNNDSPEIKITIPITVEQIGPIADPYKANYDPDTAKLVAETMAKAKFKEIFPNLDQKFNIEHSVAEGFSSFKVLFTLKTK